MRETPVTVQMMQRLAAELRGKARGYFRRIDVWGARKMAEEARGEVLMDIAEGLEKVFGKADDGLP